MQFPKLIFIYFLLLSVLGFSQHSEIGILGGTSYYLGEINPSKQVVNKINPALGVFYRKNLSKRYSLRFGANYAKLSAEDDITATEISNFRKLSFSATLLEGYGILEFHFLPYQIGNYRTYNYTPYVFIGAAIFRATPSVKNNGGYYTESEGSVLAPSMPFGLGFKFDLAGNVGMSIEWGVRKTWTDGIDGLSESYFGGYQLSNTQNKDWYAIVGLTLNYKILTKSDHCSMPGN